MYRYSYTISFTPVSHEQGGYMFYLTRNRWDDTHVIDSQTIIERHLRGIAEIQRDEQFLGNAIGMADLAYQVIAQEHSRRVDRHIMETNARPGDTSVPS